MQLKTFSASTLTQAMKNALLELGDDALIVSTSFDQELSLAQVTAGVESVSVVAKPARRRKKDFLRDVELCLNYHGVSESFFLQLMNIAKNHLNLGDAVDILSKALESTLAFSSHMPRVLALIGLPGAGKTSTTARLALRLREQKERVTIISIDHLKAGAYEQVVTYSDAIGSNLYLPQTPEELDDIVRSTQGVILIDTPGVNPLCDEDVDFLKLWVGDYPKVWVNPVGQDISEYADFFEELGTKEHLITKTDLSKRLGGVLSFLTTENQSISYWSTDPRIGSSLQDGTPYNLASLMMEKYIHSESKGDKNGSKK